MFRSQTSIGNRVTRPGLLRTPDGGFIRPRNPGTLNSSPYRQLSPRGFSSSYFSGPARGAIPSSPVRGAPYNGGASQANYRLSSSQVDVHGRNPASSSYSYFLSTMSQGGGDQVSQTNTEQFQRVRHPSPRLSQGRTVRSQYFDPYPRGGANASQSNFSFDGVELDDWSNEDFDPYDMIPRSHQASNPIPEPAKRFAKEIIEMKNDEEPSLRFVSVTPTILKAMNYKHHCTKTLFEVFGTLSSAITKGAQSAVHFCLNSKSDIVPCVFYEIDRRLGNMIRNQLYRCVGTYDERSNMRCFSVRLATAAEKQYLDKLLLNFAHEP